ncbi:MAG: DUF3455 domain-containing protein [Methylococcaceae bacterium]|jgi:hypothetical protein
MKNYNAPESLTTRRILLMASATALTVAFVVALPQPAHADRVTPPPVPTNIQVPAGNKAFLVGHAVGTQNYICLPSGGGFKFVLFTPQATLFADNDKQVTTHFFSPNLSPIPSPFPPDDDVGTIRATWQHSRDTSTVWAKVLQSFTVDPNAIPLLLLPVVGAQDGPTGGHTLTAATFIQRLNTSGGVAPSTGCVSSEDVGHQAFVPYKADYFFYKKIDEDDN